MKQVIGYVLVDVSGQMFAGYRNPGTGKTDGGAMSTADYCNGENGPAVYPDMQTALDNADVLANRDGLKYTVKPLGWDDIAP